VQKSPTYEEIYQAVVKLIVDNFDNLSESDIRISADELIIGLAEVLVNIREEEEGKYGHL
jgi:hypothetical protein